MENAHVHEIELYPPETFKTLLGHEVNKSHRYGDSLTLVHLCIEAEPATPQNQYQAETFVIYALGLQLRNTDIPSKKNNEFLILMPATGTSGARTACERIKKLLISDHPVEDGPSFKINVFIGMTILANEDRSVSGDSLMQNASRALQHARMNQITSVVNFSDLTE